MKALLALAVSVALVGCATTKHVAEQPEVTIAERVEYVIKVPPAELLELPKPPAMIDIDKATQADVARWVMANERWMNELQNRFIEVARFMRDEQVKLDALAKELNEKAGTSGDPKLVIKREEPKK